MPQIYFCLIFKCICLVDKKKERRAQRLKEQGKDANSAPKPIKEALNSVPSTLQQDKTPQDCLKLPSAALNSKRNDQQVDQQSPKNENGPGHGITPEKSSVRTQANNLNKTPNKGKVLDVSLGFMKIVFLRREKERQGSSALKRTRKRCYQNGNSAWKARVKY